MNINLVNLLSGSTESATKARKLIKEFTKKKQIL